MMAIKMLKAIREILIILTKLINTDETFEFFFCYCRDARRLAFIKSGYFKPGVQKVRFLDFY